MTPKTYINEKGKIVKRMVKTDEECLTEHFGKFTPATNDGNSDMGYMHPMYEKCCKEGDTYWSSYRGKDYSDCGFTSHALVSKNGKIVRGNYESCVALDGEKHSLLFSVGAEEEGDNSYIYVTYYYPEHMESSFVKQWGKIYKLYSEDEPFAGIGKNEQTLTKEEMETILTTGFDDSKLGQMFKKTLEEMTVDYDPRKQITWSQYWDVIHCV